MELTYKWIALANRHYLMYLNKRLASYGLSGSQYLFILNICRQPGLTQDKLPDIIHINKSNVTRALAHLEKRGFIRREVNPQDKRTAAVFPTQKALDVYPHVMEIIRGWDASVTSPLTEDEKHTLQGLLKRVVASAHEYRSSEGEALPVPGARPHLPPGALRREAGALPQAVRALGEQYRQIQGAARTQAPAARVRNRHRAVGGTFRPNS